MNYYLQVIKKYADSSGRASRKEYWNFFLVNLIIFLTLEFLIKFSVISPWIIILYNFFVLVPGIAVAVRRMHDVNKNGWYSLIPFYNIILVCTPGTEGENDYGDDPYQYEEEDEEDEH